MRARSTHVDLERYAPLARTFAKFCLVGSLATAVQFGVLQLGVQYLGMSAVAASSVGFLFSALVNYLLNYYYTHASTRPHLQAAPRFVVASSLGLAINAALMTALVDLLGCHHLVAQAISTGVVLMWNFATQLFWAMRA